ncbi:hypothetical protein LSTR_LSTR009304 [Laodelphax striatellus]|uniref:G-protein coupled receptors family 2 profile 1 domain-containing protein n=1 Tax=Laodelphax striatellus TaxID=195883 RepID=A0A482XM81_LAOST|nr:hypothetical protein LSTR_LSTR009304 [Laodelphax striatellus]
MAEGVSNETLHYMNEEFECQLLIYRERELDSILSWPPTDDVTLGKEGLGGLPPSSDVITASKPVTALSLEGLPSSSDVTMASNSAGCPRSWDSLLCWPPTKPGATATLACFPELNGIKYDTTLSA